MLTSDQEEEEEIPPLSSSTKKSTTRKKKSNNNSTNTTTTTTTGRKKRNSTTSSSNSTITTIDSNNNNSTTTTTTTVSSSNNNTKKSTRKKRETTTSESRNKKISIPLQWGNSQLHFSQPSLSINNNNINSFNNNTNIQHPLYNSINITVLSRKIKDIEEINIPNNILFRTHQYDFKLKPKQSFFDWTGTTSGFYARIKLLFNKNLKNNNLDNTNNSDNHLEDDEDEWIEYKYEKNPMIIQTFQEDYNDKSFLIVLEWRSDTGCTFNKHLYKFELEIFRTINDNNNLKCIYRIKSSSFSILSKPEVYLKRLKNNKKRNNNTIQNSNENKKKKRNDDIIVIDENDNNTINVNNGMNEMEGLTSTTTFVPSSPVLFTNSSSLIYKNNQIINNLQQEIIMNNNSGTVSPFLCSSPELNLSQSTNTHLLLNNNLNNNITNNNSINNNNNNINSNITDNFISFTPPNLSQGSFINYTPNTPNSNNNNGNVTDNVISLSFLEENYGTEIKLSQTSNTSEKSTLLNSSFQMYFNEEGRREDDFTFKAFHNFQQEEEKESDSFFNK